MTQSFIIRNATVADSSKIAILLSQLGYKSTSSDVRYRIDKLRGSEIDSILVAVKSGVILGCISLHVLPLFHANGNLGRITSLVIEEGHRGQGIGSALLNAASDWFSNNQCKKIEVTSADYRTEAHRFYISHGLERDGNRFAKSA